MKSPQKLLAISMIIYGNILMIITVLYFVFQSKQWLQNNTRWFSFGIGITMAVMAIVLMVSATKHIYPTKTTDKTDDTHNPSNQ